MLICSQIYSYLITREPLAEAIAEDSENVKVYMISTLGSGSARAAQSTEYIGILCTPYIYTYVGENSTIELHFYYD